MIDDEPESERVSALAPFRHGIFRAVWSASLVSNFGGLIQGVGAAWMMTTIATSSYQVALVQASTTLPIMLFALVAGAIADSFNRRKVMLVAQSFMLVVSALLTVFTWFGWMTPWTLLAFTFLIDSGAGLRYVAMSPNIGKVLARGFAFGFSAGAVLALLPLVARDVVKGDALTYGIMLGAFGIGAVGGALISVRLRQLLSSETMVRAAFAGFALCAFNAAVSDNAWQTSAGLLIGGACWVIALSHFNVTVQMSTPRWVVGRVLSIYQTATFGGIALGSWIWGVVADAHGAETALMVAAVTMLVGGGIGLILPLPQHTALNLDPLNRFKEPMLALDLKPRSGPIAIMIEYIIREEDVPEFLATMAERGRIRRRDGARNWTLARDLENPGIWIEHYHTPTWVEYIRHNRRATHADAVVGERIRALHSGENPPRVRRMIERPTTAGTALVSPKGPIDH
ncbi:MAG: MFS transporter [Mesorhizobium sp.]|nr:MAG: MFS transporter [Mesorhizobium sp.]